MASLRSAKKLLSNLNLKSCAVRGCARGSFSAIKQKTSVSKAVKLFGIAFGGATVLGIGFIVYSSENGQPKKKLVILGSGWGAASLVKSLSPEKFDISVISPTNYFLFTPLLPSVTVGTVEGRSICEPMRKVLYRKHKDATFYEAECTGVDIEGNKVLCHDSSDIVGVQDEFSINYDYLVVAVGAQTATYNIKGVKEHAHYLKEIKDAQVIRKNIIDSFETAGLPGQPENEKKRLLHFVVVGGGPTGVEFAAELRDWIKEDLIKYYSDELIEMSQITLVDGLNKILNTYSDEISRYTEEKFKGHGIDLVKNAFVNSIDETTIHYKNGITKELHSMPYGMVVWCAGIGPRDLTKALQKQIPGQNNRVGLITDHFLKVKNTKNIFSVGDCSTIQFKKFSEYISMLLDDAGIESGVEISKQQFEGILNSGRARFPHLMHNFKETERGYAKVEEEEREETGIFSREEFVSLAETVDTKQTSLPPTAQVAAQEGKYLGKLLTKHVDDLVNDTTDGIMPFQYRHLGSFAYIGQNKAVLDFPVIGDLKGYLSMWLWRGVYANETFL